MTASFPVKTYAEVRQALLAHQEICLLYTSDAADEEDSVDLGGQLCVGAGADHAHS